MASPLILSPRKQKSYCGRKIKLLSPAKINLYLNILGKYEGDASLSGGAFHRIESIVERVSLFDEISLEVLGNPQIKIFSPSLNLPQRNNTCLKAAQLLKSKFKIPFGFNIFLKKNIPLGSGLGGGSSNAAAVLIGISALFNLGLSKAELYKLGSKIGSDVNFFLSQSQFAFLQGRGDEVRPFRGRKLYQLIIYPGVSLSTKKVYQEFDQADDGIKGKLTKFFSNVKILKYAINRGDLSLIKRSTFNILEKNALRLCKPLRDLKRFLDSKGIRSTVSGSGSSLYIVAERRFLAGIRRILPEGLEVFTVQTF